MYSFNQLSACVKIMPVMDSHRSLKAICHFHFFFLLCLSHQKVFLHQEKILYRMIDVDDTSLKMLIFFFLLTGTALIMAVSTSQ